MEEELFKPLGIAIGLGLLVGLQREWDKHPLAGIRTFTLITLLGAISALLARDFGGWIVAAALLGLAGLLITGNWMAENDQDDAPAGQTTETAALVMFCIGAMLIAGYTVPAVVLGGATAVLLHLKDRLEHLVGNLSEGDVRAIFQFVLIALVILPLLPNETYGPYDVLNPFKIWLMVVLIVGISLSAYVVYRIVGVRAGTVLGGILGGLISSTATTVSYARQSKGHRNALGTASLVIVIASTIVLIRVGIEIAAVSRGLLPQLIPPFAAVFALMAAISVWLYYRMQQSALKPTEHKNPSQLKPAIVFGVLYALVLLLVAFVRDYFGDTAIYAAALISGLTDVDALTLSVAELFNQERVEGDTAWRAILLATLSNLAFKAGAAGVLGGRELFRIVGPAFGATIAAGLAVIFLWP
ncbi:MAG TPA: MgtC/SapB family protein [Woeseiaceae bacterium]|nr:MgtC/SapB family protein [Woeseiaceae bacterium]